MNFTILLVRLHSRGIDFACHRRSRVCCILHGFAEPLRLLGPRRILRFPDEKRQCAETNFRNPTAGFRCLVVLLLIKPIASHLDRSCSGIMTTGPSWRSTTISSLPNRRRSVRSDEAQRTKAMSPDGKASGQHARAVLERQGAAARSAQVLTKCLPQLGGAAAIPSASHRASGQSLLCEPASGHPLSNSTTNTCLVHGGDEPLCISCTGLAAGQATSTRDDLPSEAETPRLWSLPCRS